MSPTPVSLQDVIITHELLERTSRPSNPSTETTALREIAQQTPNGPDAILHALCRVGLELCEAGSCGINLLQGSQFKWVVIEGMLRSYEGSMAPADDSPCGYVLDRKSAQLLCNASRHFEWMQAVDIPVFETLITPLHKDKDEIIGTIWAVSHVEQRHFDREDLRVLSALGSHACSALKLYESLYQSD